MCQQISPRELLSLTHGVPLRPDGLPLLAIPSSSSAIITLSSTPRCGEYSFFIPSPRTVREEHATDMLLLELSGDWQGGVWNAAGIPGQEQSCAQRTGFSTCEAFIRAK